MNPELTGTIPLSIGKLSLLENLYEIIRIPDYFVMILIPHRDLSETGIIGPIPDSLGSLASLRYLYRFHLI